VTLASDKPACPSAKVKLPPAPADGAAVSGEYDARALQRIMLDIFESLELWTSLLKATRALKPLLIEKNLEKVGLTTSTGLSVFAIMFLYS
jgi:hypothetical protein